MLNTRKSFDLGSVPRISVQDLNERMVKGEEILVIDVRRHPDDTHIPGSVRFAPEDILKAAHILLPAAKEQLIATYCT